MNSYLNKIATIVPKAHLQETKDDFYFMGLVHAAYEDSDYFKFFQNRAAEGKYIILDNSTVELGHPFDARKYVAVAKEMKASEICLPDIFGQMSETLQASIDMLSKFEPPIPFNLMAIPQGKCIKDFVTCTRAMLRWPIATIGISCRYTTMFGSRKKAVEIIEPYVRRTSVKIHLLGNYMRPQMEVAPLLRNDLVRGVDSSTPCVYTSNGLMMRQGGGSPPHHKIDFIRDKYENITLLKDNINYWREACSSAEADEDFWH